MEESLLSSIVRNEDLESIDCLEESEMEPYEDDKSRDNSSDEEDDETKDTIEKSGSKKGRGINKEYEEIMRFTDHKEALKAMDGTIADNFWTKRYLRTSDEGDKIFYSCRGHSKCRKTLYLLIHSDSQESSIWLCTDEHNHEGSRGLLPKETTMLVKELLENGCEKNSFIIKRIREKNLPQLTKTQLNNLKNRIKIKTKGKSNLTLQELQKWCDNKSAIPDDPDEVFCGGFDYDLSDDYEIKYLRVFLTTKRLISLTTHNEVIATDGTYKLNYNNFPILMVGTTDYKRQFHPFGMMLTKREEASDYQFMFECLKRLSKDVLKQNYNPTILLADCADAITNGFKAVFNMKKRIYCWAHVIRAIDGKLNRIKDKSVKDNIRQDIVNFQHYVSSEQFITIARLMVTKWQQKYDQNSDVKDFNEYFQKMWCNPKRMGWFDHYCDWVPVTNNALESTNRYLKENGTLRKRLSFPQFLHSVEFGFLKEWSIEHNTDGNINARIFNLEPHITMKDYTIACQWSGFNKTIKRYNISNDVVYCTPASDKIIKLKSVECRAFFETNQWESFDDYIKHCCKKIHFVIVNENNWKLSKCTCSYWCKYYTCKHMIGVCERLGKFEYSEEAQQIPIGSNRKRGRPSKTKSALKYQPNECLEEYVYSDTESESDLPIKNKKRKAEASKHDSESDDYDLFDDGKVDAQLRKLLSRESTMQVQGVKIANAAKNVKNKYTTEENHKEQQSNQKTQMKMVEPLLKKTSKQKQSKSDIAEKQAKKQKLSKSETAKSNLGTKKRKSTKN